jgi:hypothetical protein
MIFSIGLPFEEVERIAAALEGSSPLDSSLGCFSRISIFIGFCADYHEFPELVFLPNSEGFITFE